MCTCKLGQKKKSTGFILLGSFMIGLDFSRPAPPPSKNLEKKLAKPRRPPKNHRFLRVPAKLARSGRKRQFLPPGVQVCPYYLETASRARPLWVYQWSPDSVVLVVVEKVRDRPDLHFSVLLATIGRFATMVVSQRKKENLISIFLCYLPPLVDLLPWWCHRERKKI